MSALYPWQRELWQRTMPQAVAGHHALLLRGARGIGKRRFAETIARSVLCQRPGADALPCGTCPSCSWIEQGQHPDWICLEPAAETEGEADAPAPPAGGKKASVVIKIEQIRALLDALSLTTHQGGRRIVLIDPAESMNASAANALLKSLEEPMPGTLFLLVTHRRALLPATIVSRCRGLDIPLPAPGPAVEWLHAEGAKDAEHALALAGGAPLLALEKAEDEAVQRRTNVLAALKLGAQIDPVQQAERLKQVTALQLVETMQTWSHDLLAVKLGQHARYHLAYPEAQARTASQARVEKLLGLQRKLIDARRLALHPLNLRLVAEDLLLAYRDACSAR